VTSNDNIKWYMTPSVVSVLRSGSLSITGASPAVVVDNPASNRVRRAYAAAYDHAKVVDAFGIPWVVINDRLGLRVLPDMLIAATIGAPYEWQSAAVMPAAEAALAEMEAVFGPIRRNVVEAV
jgi:hypothetical protein